MRKDERGVMRDSRGRPIAVKLDKHVTDPNSPEAVQIPEGVHDSGLSAIAAAAADEEALMHPEVDTNVQVGGRAKAAESKMVHSEDVVSALDEAGSDDADHLEGSRNAEKASSKPKDPKSKETDKP